MKKQRRSLTPTEQAECARLAAIYEKRKSEARAQGRKLTQDSVAVACGWSGQGAFSQYSTGKIALNLEALLKLSKVLSFDPAEVSPRLAGELVFENTSKNLDGTSADELLEDVIIWDEETPVSEDEVAMPYLKEVELSAGSGRFAIQEGKTANLRFGKRSLRHNGVQFDRAKVVTVRGNSMLPVLRDGATVGVNGSKTSVQDIIDGDIYAIDHNGQLRVKQLYRLPTGIRLRSFNRDEHPDEDYTFQQMQDEQIVIIGHVFWWGMYAR
ncbi:XRE family transcriptional regulator [Pseudomonas koreensis]|nr:XRE family transcriptional regulator [Pseudomonas koreensis]